MSTLQEVKDELDAIKAGVIAANAAAADLKQQIADLKASSNPVSQADLDALDATADAIIALQSGTPAAPADGGGGL